MRRLRRLRRFQRRLQQKNLQIFLLCLFLCGEHAKMVIFRNFRIYPLENDFRLLCLMWKYETSQKLKDLGDTTVKPKSAVFGGTFHIFTATQLLSIYRIMFCGNTIAHSCSFTYSQPSHLTLFAANYLENNFWKIYLQVLLTFLSFPQDNILVFLTFPPLLLKLII